MKRPVYKYDSFPVTGNNTIELKTYEFIIWQIIDDNEDDMDNGGMVDANTEINFIRCNDRDRTY